MKKKLLIVYAKGTAEIFNRQSALGSYIHCLAAILVKNGYSVRINELHFNPALQQTQSAAPAKAGTSVLKKMIPAAAREFIKDKRLFRQMDVLYEQLDKKNTFDAILEFYTYGSAIGARLSKKYHVPLTVVYDSPVLEAHTFFTKGQLFFKRRIESLERETLLQALSVVGYSNAVKNYLDKKYNTSFPFFIHQNVDYTRFEYIENKKSTGIIHIGFIGSFLKWHRVDLLLAVFTRLKKEGEPVKLFLLGNGMEYEAMKEQVKKNPYAAAIEMPGFMDGAQLLAYKEQLHIGVMPGSNWYGAPNKIFEYGAAKMAVVAPDTLTIKDLFADEKELLLFKQDEEQQLYLKLKRYIADPALMQAHAAALQLKIHRNYSENSTFEFYDHLIRKELK